MAEIRTLGLAGFDREEEAAFRELFDRSASSGWRLGSEAEACALLIDLDSMYGQMAWLKSHGSGRPIAALTAAPHADTDFLLQRPASSGTVAALLQSIEAALAPRGTVAVAPTAPIGEPAAVPAEPAPAPARPAIPALPSRSLSDYLRPGVLPGPVRLADAEPPLVIDPIAGTYLGGSPLKPLAAHCRGEIAADRWQALTPHEFERLAAELGGTQPLNRLRWLAGLCGRDGALGPELTAATGFKLAKWPQSEREFPKHFRIATAMLKQSGSIDAIAAASGATPADVANFINACHAIGMIEAEGIEPDPAADTEARSGLMSRLRGKT
jgi:hypothetical protein